MQKTEKKILSLPISEEHSLKEINYVVKKIKSFLKHNQILINSF